MRILCCSQKIGQFWELGRVRTILYVLYKVFSGYGSTITFQKNKKFWRVSETLNWLHRGDRQHFSRKNWQKSSVIGIPLI